VIGPVPRAARSARRPAPRVHWVALAVVCLLVGLLLAFYAVTHAPGGESVHDAANTGGAGVAPAAVRTGGPVIDASQARTGAAHTPARVAVLTFDDGPSSYTPQILSVLEHYRVPATFFTIGSNIAGRQDMLRRMVADGDEIGMHTFTHPDLAAEPLWRVRLEISTTELAIAGATGYVTNLLRLPYSSVISSITAGQWRTVRHQPGYRVVFADRDTQDWARPGVAEIVRAALPQGDAGAVIMLHDGGGDRSQTVDALRRIIPALLTHGYRFETVSHSIGASSPWAQTAPWNRLRGVVLLDATQLSHWLVQALTVLFWVAGGLAVLRTIVLIAFARRHVRRSPRAPNAADLLPPVTVVVPAYNEQVGIQACVRSIAASNYPGLEIIVVDDGSTDGTVQAVQSLHLPNVRLIVQANTGKPGALTTGIRAARHDVLVLVDGDTVFQVDTIHALVAPLLAAEVGAVSGNTKVGNRRGLLGRWQHIEYVIGFNLDRRLYDELECMPTVPGAVGAFRREALDDVGGLSDDTLAEDTDLTMAICRAGWRVVYSEHARAWTEAPASLATLWRQRYRWCYGTLQASWKHRHAVLERGRAGHLGRRGLPYLLAFQVALPLLTPILDITALAGLFTGHATDLGIAWLAFQALQLLSAIYAFRLDHEHLRPLWALPLQTIFYRQLMYLVVIQSITGALYGIRLRWHKPERTGTLTDAPPLPTTAGRV
jgi:cellulose synthase/poly-beta-1,6-N-acetylglucosamine synthase-like glycosyltransferase/peptidoglycan/xylan/chitin deacetylase (PgdA/CDA1 family)